MTGRSLLQNWFNPVAQMTSPGSSAMDPAFLAFLWCQDGRNSLQGHILMLQRPQQKARSFSLLLSPPTVLAVSCICPNGAMCSQVQ